MQESNGLKWKSACKENKEKELITNKEGADTNLTCKQTQSTFDDAN